MIKKLVNEIKYKKLVWVVELLIWIFILSLTAFILVFSKYNYKKNFNTYEIFLQDINGLIIGSPVKMMGVQVGYVKQIKMLEDIIFVRFLITEKDLEIPKGSVITVESSGLGGSRSLEIYPMSQNDSNEILITKPPTRLGQAAGLLYDIFEKIGKISYKITSFASNVNTSLNTQKIHTLSTNTATKQSLNLEQTIHNLDIWLDKLNKKEQKFNKQLKELK